MIDRSTITIPKRIPAPPELAAQAQALVEKFDMSFWFWHPDAKVGHMDDVRQVVHHLREYGGWEEWKAAQELQRCLSQYSNAAY